MLLRLHKPRKFPWRKTKNPYKIIVAEIMLQRTKADQVVPVYEKFMKIYPKPSSLAKAKMRDLEIHMGPLGLHWRAHKLKSLGEKLHIEYGGKVPNNREKLLSLPGVGTYVADAVLSFAYKKNVAVLDSNVVRVLRRLFFITRSISEPRRDPKIYRLAQSLLPEGKSREYNLAMLDFANDICTPRNPRCEVCPLSKLCNWNLKRKRLGKSKQGMITKYGF